jgi:hypothetical protein
MPIYLAKVLLATSRVITSSIENKDDRSVSIFILQEERDSRVSKAESSNQVPLESLQGVALAGWLLEYEIIYFYNLPYSSGTPSVQLWERDKKKQNDEWEIDTSNDTMTRNCLAGKPLVLVVVKTSLGFILYQFTFPQSLITLVAEKMELVDTSLQGICDKIKARLEPRARQGACDIDVTYEIITMDRVAI